MVYSFNFCFMFTQNYFFNICRYLRTIHTIVDGKIRAFRQVRRFFFCVLLSGKRDCETKDAFYVYFDVFAVSYTNTVTLLCGFSDFLMIRLLLRVPNTNKKSEYCVFQSDIFQLQFYLSFRGSSITLFVMSFIREEILTSLGHSTQKQCGVNLVLITSIHHHIQKQIDVISNNKAFMSCDSDQE